MNIFPEKMATNLEINLQPLETNLDELLEFSEASLPPYEESNQPSTIQTNLTNKIEHDEEPKYAKVQAKRQSSSRSKSSHGYDFFEMIDNLS